MCPSWWRREAPTYLTSISVYNLIFEMNPLQYNKWVTSWTSPGPSLCRQILHSPSRNPRTCKDITITQVKIKSNQRLANQIPKSKSRYLYYKTSSQPGLYNRSSGFSDQHYLTIFGYFFVILCSFLFYDISFYISGYIFSFDLLFWSFFQHLSFCWNCGL